MLIVPIPVAAADRGRTPTARTETGDIRSLCLCAGPRIRQGVRYDGPVWLWDLAPTVAAATDSPPPLEATGRIVTQMLGG